MDELTLTSRFRAFTTLVGPATLFGALLYYFGWVRTRALWSYYGADPSMLGFSTQDYVLRSVDAMLGPIAIITFGVLTVRAGYSRLGDHLAAKGSNSLLVKYRRPLGWIGMAATAIGGRDLLSLGSSDVQVPILLLGGVGALVVSASLAKTELTERANGEGWHVRSGGIGPEATTLYLLVALLGLFSFVFIYATNRGEAAARARLDDLDTLPFVHLVSGQELHLRGSGAPRDAAAAADTEANRLADEDKIDDYPPRYRFTYSNLRLLIETNDRLFLLPAGWSPDQATLNVVPITDDLRIDIDNSPRFKP